jgi:hypothetical protein
MAPTLQVDHRNHRNHCHRHPSAVRLVEIGKIMYNNPIKAVLKNSQDIYFIFVCFPY